MTGATLAPPPSNGILKTPSTVDNDKGYNANVFPEKNEQKTKVQEYLKGQGFIPETLVGLEVEWFYEQLSIDDYYFALQSVETIAHHIMSIYGAKITAFTKNKKSEDIDINLEKESEESSVFIHSSERGVSQVEGPQYERRIDEKYLDESEPSKAYRVESYRSNEKSIRCYFITKCNFANPNPTPEQTNDINEVADTSFLKKATEHTRKVYGDVMKEVLQCSGPVIKVDKIHNTSGSPSYRLIVGYRQRSTQGFFAAMSDLYHYYNLFSGRKYVEQFSNGVTIMGLYLQPVKAAQMGASIDASINQVMKETSLLYCLPKNPLQHFFKEGKLSVQETMYGYVCWIFSQHFLNRLGVEYMSLNDILDQSNPIHEEVLTKMKKRLRQDTYTREYILDIILNKDYTSLIKDLYVNFANTHYPHQESSMLEPTISYQRLVTVQPLSDDELLKKINTVTSNVHEQLVFKSFLDFNKSVLKTNFYLPTKVALSFRLDPSFLPKIEYPTQLHGMFLVVGSEFRGFHLRFRDVARGGIRIIRSRNREAYSINLRTLFDENYALAATQQRKNKDIPEGGSKGTILLDIDQQEKPLVAFEKYTDSILDLLIAGETAESKESMVDKLNRPEILFFGPDEGTADYMDWASQHAKRRGASFWKAFTTGKSQSMGGIPHDTYGMTTRSVHQYVLGIYRKFNLQEEECTKLQTGGPDGDLGSNEIKISKDKTMAVVDGSGVLYDPAGINREELGRLANERKMINMFDTNKLGPAGFRVLVDDKNVTLPNNDVVENGLLFRNTFHTHPLAKATVFVPCGGRPESVDLNNVNRLVDADGVPLFKYIVEGANLFFTQEARLRLEKQGIVIFKDASANKGGVTSSSLEVLAALAFNDAEFEEHMCVKDGKVPEFYSAYVKEVQEIIEKNALLEFEALWSEHKKSNVAISILSDELSNAIVQLNLKLQELNVALWDNAVIRKSVLEKAFPKLLLDKLGLDTLMERVPTNYIKAIFGAHLASQFVYKYGPRPDQFAFYEYMRSSF